MESDEDKPDTSENGPVNLSPFAHSEIPFWYLLALSSQTGFFFMRPPISVKIPKRSESTFRIEVFHFDRFLAGRMRLERNFSFHQSLDRCVAATSRGRGKEGRVRIGN